MRGAWRIGRPAGIDVFVHWTFLLLPAWIGFSVISVGAGWSAAANAIVFILAIFGCVVLHELGHALMARRFGVRTRNITLFPIGGVANLEFVPRRPQHELAIALAGPLVNAVIAAALVAGMLLAGGLSGPLAWNPLENSFLLNLLVANVLLAVFDLLPAFPMDGGRVLRAMLAMALPYLTATTIAARVGQGVAVLFGIWGLSGSPSLLLISLFVFFAAEAELNSVRAQESRRQMLDHPGATLFGAAREPGAQPIDHFVVLFGRRDGWPEPRG